VYTRIPCVSFSTVTKYLTETKLKGGKIRFGSRFHHLAMERVVGASPVRCGQAAEREEETGDQV
jgi:hypothetical protein